MRKVKARLPDDGLSGSAYLSPKQRDNKSQPTGKIIRLLQRTFSLGTYHHTLIHDPLHEQNHYTGGGKYLVNSVYLI